MPKRFHKHKILLDENMPQRYRLPLLNKQFDVKHVRDDLGKGELADPLVYELAVREQRVLVTRPLAGTKADRGIIGAPDRLPILQLDTKLCAMLKRLTPNALNGKYLALGAE
jgi:hypothetical protein